MTQKIILNIKCLDQMGIVADVTRFLYDSDFNIIESTQFNDANSKQFFMRIEAENLKADIDDLTRYLAETFYNIANKYNIEFTFYDANKPIRTLLMVSKLDHCLEDVLHRYRLNSLNIEITSIVSNHLNAKRIADFNNLPFHHLPISKDTKDQQEAKLRKIIENENAGLIILARYMQILSDKISAEYSGRIINIHHSFLPSFKGARPYHQAYGRGVKIIGATAHYVTKDLDEGPIIEQDIEHITHAMVPKELIAIGRDIERRVLSRAIRHHTEHRIIIDENRTIILR
ncbi:MAG: formyltetrahydrofolate deformylase [Rhizobiales bacterium]|nr:formyltetrahydrofolate deformylase [Hyphomicrobiales bacterium]